MNCQIYYIPIYCLSRLIHNIITNVKLGGGGGGEWYFQYPWLKCLVFRGVRIFRVFLIILFNYFISYEVGAVSFLAFPSPNTLSHYVFCQRFWSTIHFALKQTNCMSSKFAGIGQIFFFFLITDVVIISKYLLIRHSDVLV